MTLPLPSAAVFVLASTTPPDEARMHFDVGRLRGHPFGYDVVFDDAVWAAGVQWASLQSLTDAFPSSPANCAE